MLILAVEVGCGPRLVFRVEFTLTVVVVGCSRSNVLADSLLTLTTAGVDAVVVGMEWEPGRAEELV